METIEKEQKEGRYLLSRNDSAIEFAVEKLEENARSLNDLCRYMKEFTDFPLESLEDVKLCISQGPRLYIQEGIVARTDHGSLQKLYGFVPEHSELIRMAPISHIQQLQPAENLVEVCRDIRLEDFIFDGRQFTIHPDAVRRITKQFTHYASRKEAVLHRRVDSLLAELNALTAEFGFDPLVSEQYAEPGNPYVRLSRLVKNKEGITKYFQ